MDGGVLADCVFMGSNSHAMQSDETSAVHVSGQHQVREGGDRFDDASHPDGYARMKSVGPRQTL